MTFGIAVLFHFQVRNGATCECRAAEITGHVCQVLDFMHDQGQVFGTRYNLHGPRDRSFGSYGLVQMASIRVLQVCHSQHHFHCVFHDFVCLKRLLQVLDRTVRYDRYEFGYLGTAPTFPALPRFGWSCSVEVTEIK